MSKINPPFFVAIGASGSEGLDDIKDLLGTLITPIGTSRQTIMWVRDAATGAPVRWAA